MKQLKPYPLYEVVYYDDFKEMIKAIAEKYGDGPAITTYDRNGSECTHTFNELYRDVREIGESLCVQNLQKSHLAIVSENCYEWMVMYLAIASAGGVAVCVDVEQADEVVFDMIHRGDAKVIAVSKQMLSTLEPFLKTAESIQKVIVLNGSHPDYDDFAQTCEVGRKALEEGSHLYDDVVIDRNQTAAIVYTSGTTSKAKPVMLSHYGLLKNSIDSLAYIKTGSRSFGCLPLYHTYGFTLSALSSILSGVHICINGDLKTMLRDLQLFKPHTIIAVPLIAETIHKLIWSNIEKAGKKKEVRSMLKLRKFLGKSQLSPESELYKSIRQSPRGSVDLIMCGGAYLAAQVAEDLYAFGILVLQGYGVTECSPLVSVNRNECFSHSSVGTVLPGYEVKIKDGEILVRGASLMNGYYNDTVLTEENMDEDWFMTGDMGHLDKYKQLHLTGRKKNLIVLKNGKKISPEVLENHFYGIPLIKEIIAYGAVCGDSTDDVKPAIMIYPDPEETRHMASYEILEQLQREVDAVNKKLPIYQQIQMINLRESEFEKTSSRKIKR